MNMLAIAVIAVVTHAPSALAESTPVPWFVRVSTYLAPTSIGPAFKLPTAPVVTITQAQTCRRVSGYNRGMRSASISQLGCWKNNRVTVKRYGDLRCDGKLAGFGSVEDVKMLLQGRPDLFGGDPCCGGSGDHIVELTDSGTRQGYWVADLWFNCVP